MSPESGHATGFTASGPAGGGAFWAIIPAGGSGTRLWPLSRSTRPKFLLPLLGERSLLQETFERVRTLTDLERILVVCGPAHAAAIARQLPELPSANIIVEPAPRGTGPALALGTALVARQDPEAIVGSFHADHDVADHGAFRAAVRTAIATAAADGLVTIGLEPTRPETGFGYIERTDDVVVETDHGTAYRAARFVEKPDLAHAHEYLATGTFLWNAGMFAWRAGVLMSEIRRLHPALHDGILKIVADWDSGHRESTTADIWATLPEVTIDSGVMERAGEVAVVPAEMGWSDVGDWHGLGEMIEQDALGNSVRGDLLRIDTSNSVVWSETGRMVAMVGLDNIIVVDTDDALLVIDRAQSQKVRDVVERLRAGVRRELS